jgi:hypothetical protein
MKIIGTIDLAQFDCDKYDASKLWLRTQLQSLRKDCFKNNKNHFKKEFKAFSIRVLVNIAIGLALIIIYYIYR